MEKNKSFLLFGIIARRISLLDAILAKLKEKTEKGQGLLLENKVNLLIRPHLQSARRDH